MRRSLKIALGSVAVATILSMTLVGLSAASASTHSAGKLVRAGTAAKSGSAGWQGEFTYNVPTGTGNLFFHYDCPTGRKALDGGFAIVGTDPAVNTFKLIQSQPRTDITPQYAAWGWVFIWPGGTSPAGAQISFNAYCK